MGLFKSLKRFVSHVAQPVVRLLPNVIAKPVTSVATSLSNLTPSTLLKYASQGPVLGPINFVAASTAPKIAPYIQLASTVASVAVNPTGLTGASKMALNIGGLLGALGGVLGGSNATQNPYVSGLSGVLQLAGSAIKAPSPKAPAPGRAIITTPGAAMVISGAATKGLTKEIFTAGAKVLGRLGIPYKASTGSFSSALKRALGSIASLARRVPSGTMVSILAGLGLTAMEAYMLAAWYSQKKRVRRMNPANSRALRRATRRIKSFHKLCQHTDIIKTHRRSSPSFARKCVRCRKNPCDC